MERTSQGLLRAGDHGVVVCDARCLSYRIMLADMAHCCESGTIGQSIAVNLPFVYSPEMSCLRLST
jgi:hypothetical protein